MALKQPGLSGRVGSTPTPGTIDPRGDVSLPRIEAGADLEVAERYRVQPEVRAAAGGLASDRGAVPLQDEAVCALVAGRRGVAAAVAEERRVMEPHGLRAARQAPRPC